MHEHVQEWTVNERAREPSVVISTVRHNILTPNDIYLSLSHRRTHKHRHLLDDLWHIAPCLCHNQKLTKLHLLN